MEAYRFLNPIHGALFKILSGRLIWRPLYFRKVHKRDVAYWHIASFAATHHFWSLLERLCCKTLVETAAEP